MTHPPVYLFFDRKEGGIYNLVFRTGLETGEMNETVTSVWKDDIKPNRWYQFSCEIHWHIYSKTGYAIPKLDDEYFYKSQDNSLADPHKIYRRNMYNGIGNYPKIGLYRFGNEKSDRTIYFDDFKLESEYIKCE
ncbi:MAG: heparin lyase I family protein [Moheibacter sp.]